MHCLSFAREMDAKVLGIATALLCSSVPLRFSKRRTDCSGLSWASCETHRTHTRLKRQLSTKQMGPLQNLQSCWVYKFLSSQRRPSNGSSIAAVLASVSGCGRALIEPSPTVWMQMWHERTPATMVLHGYVDELLAVAHSRHATTRMRSLLHASCKSGPSQHARNCAASRAVVGFTNLEFNTVFCNRKSLSTDAQAVALPSVVTWRFRESTLSIATSFTSTVPLLRWVERENYREWILLRSSHAGILLSACRVGNAVCSVTRSPAARPKPATPLNAGTKISCGLAAECW